MKTKLSSNSSDCPTGGRAPGPCSGRSRHKQRQIHRRATATKKAAKTTAKDTEKAADKTGAATEKAAKKTGHATKSAAKDYGEGYRESGRQDRSRN